VVGEPVEKDGGAIRWRVRRVHDVLEQHPVAGFFLASYRRFKEIDGKQLAFVIGGNMFISVNPLFIIGYAIIEAFNPNRTIALVIIERFHLTGDTAELVRQTFANARSGQSVALSLSVLSLFVTGFGVATHMQTAFARAFRVTPLQGVAKLTRGAAWLVLMLVVLGLALTLRYWAQSRPWWFLAGLLALVAMLNFVFFLVSPRLLLDLPFEWRHLVPGALICVVVFAVLNLVSAFFLRNWLSAYGHAYGGFGVSLAFLSWIGLVAAFWVWIAVIAGVYWERFADSAEKAEIEELSAHSAEA